MSDSVSHPSLLPEEEDDIPNIALSDVPPPPKEPLSPSNPVSSLSVPSGRGPHTTILTTRSVVRRLEMESVDFSDLGDDGQIPDEQEPEPAEEVEPPEEGPEFVDPSPPPPESPDALEEGQGERAGEEEPVAVTPEESILLNSSEEELESESESESGLLLFSGIEDLPLPPEDLQRKFEKIFSPEQKEAKRFVEAGFMAVKIGDRERAHRLYSSAVTLVPSIPYVWSFRADNLFELGRLEETIRDQSEAIRIHELEGSAFIGDLLKVRGAAYAQLGDFEKALDDYDKAEKVDPLFGEDAGECDPLRRGELLFQKGSAHVKLELFPVAIVEYSSAIQSLLRSNSPRVVNLLHPCYYFLGIAQCKSHLYVPAVRSLTFALTIKPELVYFHDRGAILSRLGEYALAIADFSRIIDENPRFHSALANRGDTRLLMKDYQHALEDYTRAISLDPSTSYYFSHRGMALDKMGRTTEALEDYSAAIRLDPENASYHFHRFTILFEKCRHDDSLHLDENIEDYLRSRLLGFDLRRKWCTTLGWSGLMRQCLSMVSSGRVGKKALIPLVGILRVSADVILSRFSSDGSSSSGRRCLTFSDVLKALGQVVILCGGGDKSWRTLCVQDDDVLDLSGLPEGQIVAYHLIEDLPGEPDRLFRWVIRNRRMVYWDLREVAAVLTTESISRVLSVFSAAASDFRGMTRKNESDHKVSQLQSCRLLHELLLADGIEERLDLGAHVTFVPDRMLFRVPFGCLRDSENLFLIEKHSFSVSPSLRVLEANAAAATGLSESPNNLGLVCGNSNFLDEPSLECASKEVRQVIASLHRQVDQTTVLFGASFVPSLFRRCCALRPSFVHIVSHSTIRESPERHLTPNDLLYEEYRMRGRILCCNGTSFHARHMERLDLSSTKLVYLSSCDLALGQLADTGMLGFYRSCFLARCPRVICCLWNAFDHINPDIAERFYRHLGEGDVSYAQALRLAVLPSLEFPEMRDHPVYWASVQLFGHPL